MTCPVHAYIDMEFAGIYGTRQGIQIPIEIGVVLQNTDTGALIFAGKPFVQDIEVELWKNVLNDVGKRVGGQRRVFNLKTPQLSVPFDNKFHLDAVGHKKARDAIRSVHAELREFMCALNNQGICQIIFFARQRELETFRHSRVKTEGFFIRDLQEEIKNTFALREHVSLDRVSLVIGFGITRTTIRSNHFSYSIPDNYRYVIKPHKAIGDAARMMLADREFHHYQEEFGKGLAEHLIQYENGKNVENAVQ